MLAAVLGGKVSAGKTDKVVPLGELSSPLIPAITLVNFFFPIVKPERLSEAGIYENETSIISVNITFILVLIHYRKCYALTGGFQQVRGISIFSIFYSQNTKIMCCK